MTDLNQAAEMNVQLLTHETEKLTTLKGKVEKRIAEMQQIFSMLDRADGRYNEILLRAQRSTKTVPSPSPSPSPGTESSFSTRDQVLGLHDQGRSIHDIANMTGLPIGEVELIIEFSK